VGMEEEQKNTFITKIGIFSYKSSYYIVYDNADPSAVTFKANQTTIGLLIMRTINKNVMPLSDITEKLKGNTVFGDSNEQLKTIINNQFNNQYNIKNIILESGIPKDIEISNEKASMEIISAYNKRLNQTQPLSFTKLLKKKDIEISNEKPSIETISAYNNCLNQTQPWSFTKLLKKYVWNNTYTKWFLGAAALGTSYALYQYILKPKTQKYSI
jgi:hypothetical protein